ncbi:hypothetical protein A2662_00375 [Candidatus Giovannonibacteria bacterium RIFCSPHIGHO2_01_FULL_45_33]|uniref:ABC transporter domain-containing protein n=1 Tax=Candidatus Giovannonibacteria bacterium RIFCSPLOWO2_01_FULL_45_34 TaxID=1798351 RepID=A0A1F5WY70_9BACT|nr:MAG: hypothetical protein A2662_00375 [Candidatus Giovannonibacteria bacterium RIFCSPHIGHO2_01_FULL_45_33]OGF70646.1 MAG: hypothetical protein A3C73_02075 [Candidatus Giovannonibacteria bacterium RIFCSPHIGHO2_02_FULL_44_11]OGF80606.1 MAG: hypothetical protein A2930_02895 [Candidatus Giovannonibacteria bacterium RIFCSPLOWO2_01_FULL_45_34]
MQKTETIISFDKVFFEYGPNKPILDEVSFSLRRGSKTTVMGQNGAGKSTLFDLLTKELAPTGGQVNVAGDLTTAHSRQAILPAELALSVREFFEKCFKNKVYNIDPKIDAVLEAVNLKAPKDRVIKTFSGGQQARLLLASALIQDPDLLLLDEPTNNLDKDGISHLTQFLIDYKKTLVVISHDADFLNAFTDGVLYLDVHSRKVEQYSGNYFAVVKEISARIERENRRNAQIAKEIQEKKDKANVFGHKSGQMRVVAMRMREKVAELEEKIVDVRKEDKSIRPFIIPAQEEARGEIINFSKRHIALWRGKHLLLKGPNGIGKSTLLESIVGGKAKGITVGVGVKIGYYRQDFSTLNFEETVQRSLLSSMDEPNEERMRSVAAGFLLGADVIRTKIGHLSEGQKGLVAFCRLVFEKPGLLLLDEPTNHINFRHIPVIARALDKFEGAMILVSHVPKFVEKIRIDEIIDLYADR